MPLVSKPGAPRPKHKPVIRARRCGGIITRENWETIKTSGRFSAADVAVIEAALSEMERGK